MFGLGMQELIIIMGIAFLFFGGKKLPEIGAGLGQGIASFKNGLNEKESGPEKIKGGDQVEMEKTGDSA